MDLQKPIQKRECYKWKETLKMDCKTESGPSTIRKQEKKTARWNTGMENLKRIENEEIYTT